MRLGHVLTFACLCVATLAQAADAPKSAIPPLGSAPLEARFQGALALYARGVALGKSGNAAEAKRELDRSIEELRAVIEREPRAWVYYSLGQALRRRGELDAAIVAYRSALDRIAEERLPDRAKADFIDRTKQQIGACTVEKPTLQTARTPERTSEPLLPVSMRPVEVALVARTPVRTRYSVAAPAAVTAVAGGLLIVGGSLYGVSGSRYDGLIADGCGSARACDDGVFGGVRTMERAGIGLMIAGGVVLAADIGLWAAWRRR